MDLRAFLPSFNLNRAAHTASVIIILTLGTFLYKTRAELKETQIVYTHPNAVAKINTIRVEGPVRIVTRIIETPAGAKETTITEDHAAVTEKVESSSATSIVPIAIALAPARTDRYLLGVGLLDFSPRDLHQYRMLAGYSFKNRVDVFYGVGVDDGLRQSVNVIFRF